jgi:hypothetical protein
MIFQKMILIVATLVLIILLVVIGVTLSKASVDEHWVPVVGECPDYWVDMSGNGEACLNTHNLGRCNLIHDNDGTNANATNANANTMNFNQAPFTDNNGLCSKYKWATSCQVTWDGITSGIKNPCDTS